MQTDQKMDTASGSPEAGSSDKRVHVKVNLDDGDTAEPVATVDIPFRVE